MVSTGSTSSRSSNGFRPGQPQHGGRARCCWHEAVLQQRRSRRACWRAVAGAAGRCRVAGAAARWMVRCLSGCWAAERPCGGYGAMAGPLLLWGGLWQVGRSGRGCACSCLPWVLCKGGDCGRVAGFTAYSCLLSCPRTVSALCFHAWEHHCCSIAAWQPLL